MRTRNRRLQALAAILAGLCVSRLAAQQPPPRAYTVTAISMMTEASLFSGRESNVTLHRDGSRELVEVLLAPQSGNATTVHMRYLFDFAAHKAYTLDVVSKACSWMRYVSANAPINYDPITGVSALGLAQANVKPTGTETVNGIPARRYEMGGASVWIAEKEGFIAKSEMRGGGGKTIRMLEVTKVTFDRPAEALFTPPAGCNTEVAGEWSDTGVNAHTSVTVGVK